MWIAAVREQAERFETYGILFSAEDRAAFLNVLLIEN